MANELNVNLNIIPIQIIEQDKGNITPITGMNFKYESGATHIEVGENKITANIEAVFIYLIAIIYLLSAHKIHKFMLS